MLRLILLVYFITRIIPNLCCQDSQQRVVVLVPNLNANQGLLYKFESRAEKWIQIGAEHAITIGEQGVAWSESPHAPPDALYKVEGDKRSPAGIFPLRQTFGRFTAQKARYIQMPYEEIGPNAQCIEDKSSSFYNQIVFDNTQVNPDWDQDDRMLRQDNLYDWGIFVEVNEEKKPGKGSCIFIHIWRGSDKPTAGCTAMSKKHLTQLVYWLELDKNPQLVLMTIDDYQRLREELQLPSID